VSDEEHPTRPIDDGEIERLHKALALATAGTLDEALELLNGPGAGEGGELEEMLRVFFTELRDTNARMEQVIADLEASKRELEEKLVTIRAQRDAIRQLGTPIVDAWEGTLVVPVIGTLDEQRARDVGDMLLERVSVSRARWVLLDLTGVALIDAVTAGHLLEIERAVSLLGARCLVTGIRPGAASALISLGVDLGEVTALRSLKEGLRYCIAQDRKRRAGGGGT
jgi:rsbT co-antagonist protein RsbR